MLELTVTKSTLITPLQPQPLNSVSSTGTMYISVLCGWYPAHTEWLACSMIHSNFQQNYIHTCTHIHTYTQSGHYQALPTHVCTHSVQGEQSWKDVWRERQTLIPAHTSNVYMHTFVEHTGGSFSDRKGLKS